MPDGCPDSTNPQQATPNESTLVHEIASITGLEWGEATQLLRRHSSNLEAAINAHFHAVDSEVIPAAPNENVHESKNDYNRSPTSSPSQNGHCVTSRIAGRDSNARVSGSRLPTVSSPLSEPATLIGRLKMRIRELFRCMKSVTSWLSLFCLRFFTIESGIRRVSTETDFAAALSQSLLTDAESSATSGQVSSPQSSITGSIAFSGTTIEEAMAIASRDFKPLIILIADEPTLTDTNYKRVRTFLRSVLIDGELGSRVTREACMFGFSPSQSFSLRLLTNLFTNDATTPGSSHLSFVLPFVFDPSLLPSMRQSIERNRRNGRSPGVSYMSSTSVFGPNCGRNLPVEQQQNLFQTIIDIWSTIECDQQVDPESFRLNLLKNGVIRFFSVDFTQSSRLDPDSLDTFKQKCHQALDFGNTLCELLRQQCDTAVSQQTRDRDIIRAQERDYEESLRLDRLKEQQKRDLEAEARKAKEQREIELKAEKDKAMAEQARRQQLVIEMKQANIAPEECHLVKEDYSSIVVRIPGMPGRVNFKVSKNITFQNFTRVVAVSDYLFPKSSDKSSAMIVRNSLDPIGISCRFEVDDEDNGDSLLKESDYTSPIPTTFDLVPSFKACAGKFDGSLSIKELNLLPSAVLHLVAN